MNKLFALFLTGSLLLGIVAGCTPAPAPTEAELAPAEEMEEPMEEAEEPMTEKSKVVVWMAGDDARFMMESDIPAMFEEANPDYEVEIVQLPWDALHDKIVASFTGGESPSVSQGADHWVGEFAILGGLEPLDDFKSEMGYQDDDFLPNAWEHFRYADGVLYAAPFIWESRLLFYRTDLLEEAGFEGPPTNFEEMVEFGKALTNGEDQFGVAHQESWLDFHFFSWLLYAVGGDFVNEDFSECTLTNEAGIEAITFYKQLYDENIIPKDPAQRVETFKGFKEGYYAMAESGAWWFGLLGSQAPELEGKWDVALLPEDVTTITYGHPNPWVVPASSENKEGAKAWMAFMLQPEIAAEWADFYGQTPAIKAAFDDPKISDSPEQQAMLESALRGVNSLHNVPAAETITEVVWNMLAEVRDDIKEPEAAAEDTCQQMNDLLANK